MTTSMTNQEKTQAALEAVRTTEGLEHLKELSFGCDVLLTNVPVELGPYMTICNDLRARDDFGGHVDLAGLNSWIDRNQAIIIGHPVQLQDILVAIQHTEEGYIDTAFETIGHMALRIGYGFRKEPTDWVWIDLCKTPEQNMLDNPELTDFLCELLVKK